MDGGKGGRERQREREGESRVGMYLTNGMHIDFLELIRVVLLFGVGLHDRLEHFLLYGHIFFGKESMSALVYDCTKAGSAASKALSCKTELLKLSLASTQTLHNTHGLCSSLTATSFTCG